MASLGIAAADEACPCTSLSVGRGCAVSRAGWHLHAACAAAVEQVLLKPATHQAKALEALHVVLFRAVSTCPVVCAVSLGNQCD